MKTGSFCSDERKRAHFERMKQVWAQKQQTYEDGCEVYFA